MKTSQEIQDDIFRKMSTSKKIKLASELTSFCLKLNQLKIMKKIKTKWKCDVCDEEFKTKKELVEHLKSEFEEATETVDRAVGQLESLGVKHPY